MKAYFRRAMSYKTYGQYKEALADLNEIKAFEPKNKEASKEYDIVKTLFEEDLQKNFAKQQKQAKAQAEKQAKQEAAKAQPKVQEVSSNKPMIEEIKDAKPPTETKAPEPTKRVKVDESTIKGAVKLASKEIGKETVRIPNTAYGFEADLNSLQKDENNLYNYLSKIPPSTYSKIYKKTDINVDFLVVILKSLNSY